MSSLSKAGVAIRKSNRIGHAAALYACNGLGQLQRVDYRTAKEARTAARALAQKSGWTVHEDLSREDFGDQFSSAQSIPRGVAAVARRFP